MTIQRQLLFVKPYVEQSVGIDLKIAGQLNALESLFDVNVCSIIPPKESPHRFSRRLRGEVRAIMMAKHSSEALYYRYSPACPIFNLALRRIAAGRRVWIELNSSYLDELPANYRSLRMLHRLARYGFGGRHVRLLPVTAEIAERECLPPDRTVVMPNGYAPPRKVCEPQDRELLASIAEQIRGKKEQEFCIGILVASHFREK